MLFHINIINRNLLEFIPELSNQEYKILGTKVTHGKNIKDIEKTEKFAIIMGNEGNGMSEEVEELCDEFIYIDMNEACESLNVGVQILNTKKTFLRKTLKYILEKTKKNK